MLIYASGMFTYGESDTFFSSHPPASKRACRRGIRDEMSKMHGSAKEERGEDSRVVHREPSPGVAGDGAKTHGRCEEVEHPLYPLMKTTD